MEQKQVPAIVCITAQVSSELAEALRARATLEDRSVSAIIRKAVLAYLEKEAA